jgi:predicted flavoprotein YhiN
MLKTTLTREEFLNPKVLAKRIKGFPVTLIAAAPIDEAISTTGGIPLSAITDNFALKNRSNTFCIGEMLDWNAPTGGYLLQACFSLGVDLARKINQL